MTNLLALPLWSKYGYKSSHESIDDGMFVRAHAFAAGFDKGIDCNFELVVFLSLMSLNISFSTLVVMFVSLQVLMHEGFEGYMTGKTILFTFLPNQPFL